MRSSLLFVATLTVLTGVAQAQVYDRTVRAGPSLQHTVATLPAARPREKTLGGSEWTTSSPLGHPSHRSFHYGKDYAEYELLLETGPTPDEFFLTVLPPTELTTTARSLGPPDGSPIQHHALAKYPERQLMHSGDVLTLEFSPDPADELRIVDYTTLFIDPEMTLKDRSKLQQERMTAAENGDRIARGEAPIQATSYTPPPRDFSEEVPDLIVFNPTISINGGRSAAGYLERARGPLVWIYVPNHGRYILSLLPQSELGFSLGGDLLRDHMKLAADGDSLEIDFGAFPIPAETAHQIYLRHEPGFKPSAIAQQARVTVGAISPEELASLQR